MPAHPVGTVTFLFTDIEGSTRLLQQLGAQYSLVLETHNRILRAAIGEAAGYEFQTQGDGLFAAFPSASTALSAAVAAQRALHNHSWPTGVTVRVRMALHTGLPSITNSGYVGLDLHRTARICAMAHGGQVLLSQATRDLLEHHLPPRVGLRDLGEHRLRDLQMPEHLYQVVLPDLPDNFPPIQSLKAHRHNIPIQMTSFVGRDREVADIKNALAKTRLVTLTGPGGCGKTRLALHVAGELVDAYQGGVWIVELASLSDPGLVLQTVAFTVGVREEPGRSPFDALADHLEPRHLLIVLDNCEHLLPATAELADRLLRVCPDVRILTTSREELRVGGELTYPVPSLPVPDLSRMPPLDHLAEYGAVRLFAERAAFALPGFELTAHNAVLVAGICHRLDGIPLAIELAAARVRVLSLEQIQARLDDRFNLLTGGSRTTLPRHRTLRAAMDWSHDLLSRAEQVMFRRLSVFAGGFILEAAEAACPAAPGEPEPLDLLIGLVHRSLVIAEGDAREVRYRLLETVRQYAQKKLAEAQEEAEIQRRQCAWYVALAERAEPELRGSEQAAWLERLDVEHDNLRAALRWSVGSEAAEAGLRLAAALWWFWSVRGYYREGSGWLDQVLRRSSEAAPALRAKALIGAGHIAMTQGAYAQSLALLGESLAINRRLGDKRSIAVSLNWLGRLAWCQGDFQRAGTLYEEGLGLARESGAKDTVGALLNTLGVLAAHQGNYASARSFYEESLESCKQASDKRGIALAIGNLGVLAFRQGEYAAARSFVGQSLTVDQELGDKRGSTSELEVLGFLAVAQGRTEEAARILGAAEALREAIGAPLSPSERAVYDYERQMSILRASLSPEVLGQAWADGRAMTLEQAIEYATRSGT